MNRDRPSEFFSTVGIDARALRELSAEQFDALPFGVVTLDRGGFVVRYNRTEAELSRRSVHATVGKHFFREIAPCTNVAAFEGRFETFARGVDDDSLRFDFSFPFRWGKRDVEIAFLRHRGIESIDVVVTSRRREVLVSDVSQAERRARAAHVQIETPHAVRPLPDEATWFDDCVASESIWSYGFYKICDLAETAAVPTGGVRSFVHPDDAAHVEAIEKAAFANRTGYALEHRIVTPNDDVRFVAVRARVAYDAVGRLTHVSGTACDISARRNEEQSLWRAANHDALTGVGNRHRFETCLETALEDTANIGRRIAVIFIDLDRFKTINDSFGHRFGDRALRAITERLKPCLRTNDLLARLSGDEFTILVAGFDDERLVDALCSRVLQTLESPLDVDGREICISASIGVSLFPDHGSTVDELVHAADSAMYESKISGIGNIVRYSDVLMRSQRERATVEHELVHALADGRLEMYFQPIVDSDGYEIVGAESLIRWNHQTRGLVPPGDFIGIAERNGSILAIGAWAISDVCAQLRRAIDAGFRPVPVSVNVSAVQLRAPGLLDVVRAALDGARIEPRYLILELTESVASDAFDDTVRALRDLRTLGVGLAIDDFGTGYSSLAYLKHFPIDAIKLDRAFVIDIGNDARDLAIAEAVVTLADRLGLEVVAEGIETFDQARRMAEIGCHRLQGYLFGRPMPAREFFALALA